MLVVTDARSALWALAGATAGTVLVALWTIAVMLFGDGVGLFAGPRLNDPLGYVNAQGAVYLLALLPLLSLAEWRHSPALAGLGAGLGTLCAGLAFLSQSRGVLLALVVALIVMFAVVPGRLRRLAALLMVLAPIVVASRWLLNISDQGAVNNLSKWPVAVAAVLLVLGSLGSGVAWWLLNRVHAGLRLPARRQVRVAWLGLVAVSAVVLVVAVAVDSSRITDRARAEYHAFVDLGAGTPASAQATRSRLLSGSGVRYDYWRIALNGWRREPATGLGAGGYAVPYYQERRSPETIRQPHSLPLEVLSELGLVGGLLLAAWLAAIGWGMSRALRRRTAAVERHLVLAATGVFVAWLMQTSVDWLHLLPGLTGVALVAVAILLRRDGEPAPARADAAAESRRHIRPARRLAVACAGLAVIAGLLTLSRQALSEHYLSRAQENLNRGAAADALALADRSLRIHGAAVDAYYIRSAALGQLDRPGGARRALRDALGPELAELAGRAS
jgi:hypothetical protein